MLVFIDESGDTGMKIDAGSSSHFVVVALVFDTASDAAAARTALGRLRSEKLGWRAGREFKFNNMDTEERKAFFLVAQQLHFRYFSFVLDKARLSHKGAMSKPHSMYMNVVSWVVNNALPTLHHASIMLDSRANREFYRTLSKALRVLAESRDASEAIREVRSADSKHDDLLQFADMVAGAVHRSFARDKRDSLWYVSCVEKKGKTQRWPLTPKTT